MFTLIMMTMLFQEEKKQLKDNPRLVEMQKVAMQHRTQNGKKKLILDENCCIIAQRWANYMAQNNYFEHGGGEQIIGMGYSSPKAVMSGWMNSPGHRYWMLSNSKYVGWGVQKSRNGTLYWVGVFRDKIPKVRPWNGKVAKNSADQADYVVVRQPVRITRRYTTRQCYS